MNTLPAFSLILVTRFLLFFDTASNNVTPKNEKVSPSLGHITAFANDHVIHAVLLSVPLSLTDTSSESYQVS